MRTPTILSALVVGLAIASAPRASWADVPPETEAPELVEARRQFVLGVEAQDEGRYQEALAHYRATTIGSPRLLFNIGTCLEKLGELLAAETAFGEALGEADKRKVEEVAAESRAKLGALRENIPRVTIRIPPDVAVDETLVLLVDDRPVPIEKSTFDLRLDPGSHRLLVRSERQIGVFSVALELPVRATRVIDVDLGAERTEPQPKTVVIERESAKKSYTPALIAGAGLTSLAAAAIVTGIIGHNQRARYNELNGTPTTDNLGEREDLRLTGQTFFVANAVFSGLAVGAAGVAIYFLLRPPLTSSPKRSALDRVRGGVTF